VGAALPGSGLALRPVHREPALNGSHMSQLAFPQTKSWCQHGRVQLALTQQGSLLGGSSVHPAPTLILAGVKSGQPWDQPCQCQCWWGEAGGGGCGLVCQYRIAQYSTVQED